MENKIKQLRKGIFEMVILQILRNEEYYGYSLIKTITDNCSFEINEGTIYPILSRISKDELIKSHWVESSKGPPRKYYFITPKGEEVLDGLELEFQNLSSLIIKTKKLKINKKTKKKELKVDPKKEEKNEK
ncbi:MAG: PadR family transcriptional regulator [Acidobacteriota bacterium]